jgi:hypothetical protein
MCLPPCVPRINAHFVPRQALPVSPEAGSAKGPTMKKRLSMLVSRGAAQRLQKAAARP